MLQPSPRFIVCLVLSLGLGACRTTEMGKQNNNSAAPVANSASTAKPIEGPVQYTALGDSTGIGVGARDGGYVARIFRQVLGLRPESKLTNLCVSGATTSDVIRGQLDDAVAANPNLVTLGIGINDIGHGISKDQFARNYEQILSTLKTKTSARIVVSNIPDISSAPRIPDILRPQYQQTIVDFNELLTAIAARHGVTVFDVFSITHESLATHPEYFSADGFHPSDAGYEMWAERMWPVIAGVIGEAP